MGPFPVAQSVGNLGSRHKGPKVDNSANAVNQLDSQLDQMSPDQLLARYKGLSDQGITNISDYTQNNLGVATAKDQAYFSAFNTARNLLGRDITSNEFAQLAPIFYNPADQSSGITAGRQALANLAQQQQTNPQSPNSPINPNNPNNTLGKYAQPVNDIFQQLLSRGATPQELSHFEGLLASGQTDAFTLGQFVKQLPEYQTQQDTTFRSGLNTELSNYDVNEFNREKQGVLSQYAQNGLPTGSSPSLDYALTDLMGRIAQNRSQYIAGLSAQQYQGNQANARQDYQTNLDQMYNNQTYNRDRSNSMTDYLTQRGYQGADYATQQKDYMNYLNNYRPQSGSGMNPLTGALAGATTGAAIGGPWGAAIGAGAGGAFGYLNR